MRENEKGMRKREREGEREREITGESKEDARVRVRAPHGVRAGRSRV